MEELKGICKYCLGCNRLENPNFKGVQRCANTETVPANILEILRKEWGNGKQR